ncbi:hypothetical protein GCM10022210_01780 [Mucilaginibacter dorajii]|uniref:Uncharacterized protein n=2 Tax=Mucilaginibacter dorajii TaxID=692994 RepID=A0ABP7P1M7_9SPHI
MLQVEILLVFSLGIYCRRFFHIYEHIPFFSVPILAPLIILSIVKWSVFERKDKWENYVKEFNELPKWKNKVGVSVTGIIILFVFLNFVFAVNLNLQPNGLKW